MVTVFIAATFSDNPLTCIKKWIQDRDAWMLWRSLQIIAISHHSCSIVIHSDCMEMYQMPRPQNLRNCGCSVENCWMKQGEAEYLLLQCLISQLQLNSQISIWSKWFAQKTDATIRWTFSLSFSNFTFQLSHDPRMTTEKGLAFSCWDCSDPL